MLCQSFESSTSSHGSTKSRKDFYLTIWSMYHNHVNNEHVANEHGPKLVKYLAHKTTQLEGKENDK
jgi:hypothetical protein